MADRLLERNWRTFPGEPITLEGAKLVARKAGATLAFDFVLAA